MSFPFPVMSSGAQQNDDGGDISQQALSGAKYAVHLAGNAYSIPVWVPHGMPGFRAAVVEARRQEQVRLSATLAGSTAADPDVVLWCALNGRGCGQTAPWHVPGNMTRLKPVQERYRQHRKETHGHKKAPTSAAASANLALPMSMPVPTSQQQSMEQQHIHSSSDRLSPTPIMLSTPVPTLDSPLPPPLPPLLSPLLPPLSALPSQPFNALCLFTPALQPDHAEDLQCGDHLLEQLMEDTSSTVPTQHLEFGDSAPYDDVHRFLLTPSAAYQDHDRALSWDEQPPLPLLSANVPSGADYSMLHETSDHAQTSDQTLSQLVGKRPREPEADTSYDGIDESKEDEEAGAINNDIDGHDGGGDNNDGEDDDQGVRALAADFGLLLIGAPATKRGAAPVRDYQVKQRVVNQCLTDYFASFELEENTSAPKRVQLRFEDAARSCIRRMWSGQNGLAGVRRDVLDWLAPLLRSVRAHARRFWSHTPAHAPPSAISVGMTLLPPCVLPANHRQSAPTIVAFVRWVSKQIAEEAWMPAISPRWCWTVVDVHSKSVIKQGLSCATEALQDHIVQLELQLRESEEADPLPHPAECPMLGRLEAADVLFEQWMHDDGCFDLYAERRTLNDIIMDRTIRASGQQASMSPPPLLPPLSTPDAHEHRFTLQLRRPRERDDHRAGEVHTLMTILDQQGERCCMERRLHNSRECVRLVQQLHSSSKTNQAHGGIQARLFQVSACHSSSDVIEYTVDELRAFRPADTLPHRYVAPPSDATCPWHPRQRDVYSLAVLVWEILMGRIRKSAQPPVLTHDNFDAVVQDITIAPSTKSATSTAAPWPSLRELLQSAWSGRVQDTSAFLQQLHDQLSLLISSVSPTSSSSSSSLPPSAHSAASASAGSSSVAVFPEKQRLASPAHTPEEWFADYLNVPRYLAKNFFTSSPNPKNLQALHVLRALQGGYDLAGLEARNTPLLVVLRLSELGLIGTDSPASSGEEVHPRLRHVHLASFVAWVFHSVRHKVSHYHSVPWPLPQCMEQQDKLLETLVPFAIYTSVEQLVRQWRVSCHSPAWRFQCCKSGAEPETAASMMVHWFSAEEDPCYSALATAFLNRPALVHEALQLRQILAHVCESVLIDEVLDLSGRFDLPLGLLHERGPWAAMVMRLVNELKGVRVVWYIRTRDQGVVTRVFSPPTADKCRRTVLLCADTWPNGSNSTNTSATLGIRPGSVGIAWWPSHSRFHTHISEDAGTAATIAHQLTQLGAAMCASMPRVHTERMQPQKQLLDAWCTLARARLDDPCPLYAGRERLTALVMPSPRQPHGSVFAAVAALLAPHRPMGAYELRQLCAWKMAGLLPESPLLPEGWVHMDHTQLRALRIMNTAWPGGDVELRMLVELLGVHISVLRATMHPSQQVTSMTPSLAWVQHTLRPSAACVALLYQVGANEFHWVDAITDAVPRTSLASSLEASVRRCLFSLVSRPKVEQQSTALLPAARPHPTSASAVQLRQHVWRSVVCNECNQQLVGERLKCTVCADYDVCTRCVLSPNSRRHPSSHLLVRLAPPALQPAPRTD